MYYFSHKPQTISAVIFAPFCHSHEIAPPKGQKTFTFMVFTFVFFV